MFRYPSHSTQHQDLFTVAMTKGKKNGTYVEIGAKHPTEGNNTYLLESLFGWRGVSVEISKHYADMFNNVRSNPCICADALTLDYEKVFAEHGLGPHIDFIQFDIEPAPQTMQALQLINFDKYSFSVLTFEHDYYTRIGKSSNARAISRNYLSTKGYQLVVADVCHDDLSFEDWYVHPQYVPQPVWKQLAGESVKWNRKAMLRETREALTNALSAL